MYFLMTHHAGVTVGINILTMRKFYRECEPGLIQLIGQAGPRLKLNKEE